MKFRPITKLLLVVVPAIALSLSPAAQARGKDGYYSGHGHHDYGRYAGYNGHRYSAGYSRGYRQGYRNSYHHSGHSSHRGGYLVGGLLAGSLITYALTRPQERYVYDEYRTTRVIRSAPSRTVYSTAEVSRRLFRDRDGNCFERTENGAGDELLLELPAEECAW